MAIKKQNPRRKAVKKTRKKARPAKPMKANKPQKKAETKKPPTAPAQIVQQDLRVELPSKERYTITVRNIRGDTAVGDLLVTFPRTREVLARKGLRLEAENAGDIYMTLDAFSAMNGLKTESLLQELAEAAKEPSPQQALPQLAAPPAP